MISVEWMIIFLWCFVIQRHYIFTNLQFLQIYCDLLVYKLLIVEIISWVIYILIPFTNLYVYIYIWYILLITIVSNDWCNFRLKSCSIIVVLSFFFASSFFGSQLWITPICLSLFHTQWRCDLMPYSQWAHLNVLTWGL